MSYRFEFKRVPQIAPIDVELMLRRYGIPVTGRDMGEFYKHGDGGKGDKVNRQDYGWFALSVPAQRAGWAEYLLCRWGYPACTAWVNPGNANVQAGPMPPEWGVPAEAHTPIDWLVKLMTNLIGGQGWDLRPQVKRPSTRRQPKLGRTYL